MAYTFYLDGVILPITPAKVEFKKGNQNKTMNLIGNGEVNLLKAPGLTEVEFEAQFPQSKYHYAVYEGAFKKAEYYLLLLDRLKLSKKPFQFLISRVSPEGELMFDSNMTVGLEEWSITEEAENGLDLTVKIKLKQYVSYGAKIYNQTPAANAEAAGAAAGQKVADGAVAMVKEMQPRPSDKMPPKTYTVKPGDPPSLWEICKRELGESSRCIEIAKLSGIVEPNRISVGQVIKFA